MRLPYLYTFLTLIGVALPNFSQAQDRAPDYATIMRGLEAHPGQLRSVSAKYTRVEGLSGSYAATIKAPSDYGLQNVTNVEWAFKGPKYYEQVTDTKDETQQNDHQRADAKNHREMTRIFDGNQEHHFDSGETSPGIRYHYDSVTNTPHVNFISPLDCGYLIDGKWIATALKAGQGALVGTEQDPKFGLLSILTCQSDHNLTIRFWVAPKYNYMSVRTEMTAPVPNKPNASIVETYRCLGAVKVENIWMPGNCSIEAARRTDGSDVPESQMDYKDISYQVNNVPDSRFDTTMPAGSVLADNAAGTRYYIGVHGEKILDETYIKESKIANESPYRWLFVGSVTIILALGMGVMAKWRRRSANV
ncbi:MAG: hypothetical protein JWL77_3118 [Chthonomonadaceae bacterium]|nr:hypothetical protein [Chthonomonadaceae bacterium]